MADIICDCWCAGNAIARCAFPHATRLEAAAHVEAAAAAAAILNHLLPQCSTATYKCNELVKIAHLIHRVVDYLKKCNANISMQ